MNRPVVAVVTPVLNGERWIEQTVESVLRQTAVRSGRSELRYIVMDGGSTDATMDKLRQLAGNSNLRVTSCADGGMYSALSAGFRLVAPGSTVCAYLNAGDLWHETALDVVLDALQVEGVRWVCGYQVAFSKRGEVIYLRLPFRYRSRLFDTGAYLDALPPVQQESTFWDTSLLEQVDLNELASFRLAGDYYLWHRFSTAADLYTVASLLGGFRVHGGHLSDARDQYRKEVSTFTRTAHPLDWAIRSVDKMLWRMPDTVKKVLAGKHMLRYDRVEEAWR